MNIISGKELNEDAVKNIILTALQLKEQGKNFKPFSTLSGKTIALYFEKPSLRTKVTFEIAIKKLGGECVYIDCQNSEMRKRESIKDLARNLSQWCDCIVARVYDTKTIEELIEYGNVPVINALCNTYHPCQGLADFMTLYEESNSFKPLKIAYFGEPNNISNTLKIFCDTLGWTFKGVCPKEVIKDNKFSKGFTSEINDVKDFDYGFTDSWVSMGDTTPLELKVESYYPYQCNMELLNKTNIKHILHCQPAHRGYEITDEIMDVQSKEIIDRESQNRLWTEMSLLLYVLNKKSA